MKPTMLDFAFTAYLTLTMIAIFGTVLFAWAQMLFFFLGYAGYLWLALGLLWLGLGAFLWRLVQQNLTVYPS